MVGEMYFVNQILVRCVGIDRGWASLQYIDQDGFVRYASAQVSALVRLRDFLSPHTAWPHAGYLDQIEAEKEQQAVIAERKARAKAAKKARRTNKLKRVAA